MGVAVQPAVGSQASIVQASPSSQPVWCMQAQAAQVSAVHASPSSQSASVLQVARGTASMAESASRRPAPATASAPGAPMSAAAETSAP